MLDFPGKTAATVFTPGCNFACPFCYNAELATNTSKTCFSEAVSLDEFFSFLEKRHGLLDGVCITGGEPLMQPDIADFCARIVAAGFAVKLDTNGTFPDRLRTLVEENLVDYVALDVKNTPERYGETVGIPHFDTNPIDASIDFLLQGTTACEFRTTVVRELHTPDDLRAIAQRLKDGPAWFLQSYLDAESVIAGAGSLHAWNPDDLRAVLPCLQKIMPRTFLRGVE